MDDAAIEAEIDLMMEKMRQDSAEMKRQRAESAAQWKCIEASSARIRALLEETRQLRMEPGR